MGACRRIHAPFYNIFHSGAGAGKKKGVIAIALKVGELFATLNLDTSGFNTSIISATNLATSEGKAISAILGGIKLGKELVDSAIDFETAFAGVKKTVDETALTSYADLEKMIRRLGTELPATAEEIAGIAEISGQLGIGADDLEKFVRVMVDLGETTNLSSEEAATSLARFANIMGTSSDEYSNLGSTIVDLGNNHYGIKVQLLFSGCAVFIWEMEMEFFP